MPRPLSLGILVAFVICGVLFFLLREDGSPGTPGVTPMSETAEERAAWEAEQANSDGTADEAGEEEAADEEPVPDTPPLLSGEVIGEGSGVPNAQVMLFSADRVEALIRRAEMELSGLATGGIPDVSGILNYVRNELNNFKNSAIIAKTDYAGRFEVRNIPEGGYFLLTLAPRWLFRYGDVVSLSEARPSTITLTLDRGASIAGRIVRPSGEGVAGVTVLAEFAPPSTTGIGPLVRRGLRYINGEFLKGPFQTKSGPDGSFEVTSLPPGTYNLVATSPKGLESTTLGVETGTSGAVVLLGEGAEIEGFLMTSRGSPLGEIPIRLERLGQAINIPFPGAGEFITIAERLLGEPPREKLSDAAGRFGFRNLGAGRYRLSVETPGLNPYQQEVTVDWGERLDLSSIMIDLGASVQGRVVAADSGAPLEGARVTAVMSGGGMAMMGGGAILRDLFSGRLTVETDAQGYFELFGLRPGTPYAVSAELAGYAGDTQRNINPDGEPIEFGLVPGVPLQGIVLEVGTGEPVADATVRAGGSATKTGPDGRFSLDSVVATGGNMSFMFGPQASFRSDRDEERLVDVAARAPGYVDSEVNVDLDAVEEVILELEPIIPISGIVRDATGAPRPGALVRLTPDFPDDMGPFQFDTSLIFFAVTVADENGEFTMDRYFAEDQAPYVVIADFPGYTRGKSEVFRLEDVPTFSPVEVQLRAASTIRGVVTDGSGPISGATVRLSPAREGGDPREMMMMQMLGLPKGGEVVYTGPDGTFEYDSHEPGDFQIGAEMIGFTDSALETFSIAEGETVEVSLSLDPGSVLTGVVTDDLGEPIEGAVVRVLEESGVDEEMFQAQLFLGGALRSTRTDENGNYEITGLAIGGYAAVAEKRGFAKGIAQGLYVNGVSTQNLIVMPAATFRGQVVESATGEPVSEYEVYLSQKEGDLDFGPGLEPITAADGVFERDNLDPGDYDLSIRAAGFGSTTLEVSLQPGTLHEEVIELDRAASITGTVVDGVTGEPIRGARVGRAAPESDADPASMRGFIRDQILAESVNTSADGTFTLDTVPAGTTMLVVNHDDYVQLRQESPPVSSGEQVTVVLSLVKGKTVSGRVRTVSGQPAGYRFLILSGTDDDNSGVRKTDMSNEDGDFSFAGLEPGNYEIRSNFRGMGVDGVDVTVDGDVENVVVTVPDEDE